MAGKRPFLESPLKLIAVGVLLLIGTVSVVAIMERHTLIASLEQESAVAHRLASQRADQHDAHMTALSAVAMAAEGEQRDLFLGVAAAISRFYPRIDEIQLVSLDPKSASIGTEALNPAFADIIRSAAKSSHGNIALLPHPEKPQHYIMVKRSPNSDAARYGLMLGIDAEKLLDEMKPLGTHKVVLNLSLPDGRPLITTGNAAQTVRISKTVGSASQPLLLEAGMEIGLMDLLPPVRTALALLAVMLAYFSVLVMLRQRSRTRRALEQVRLSALDSRLAHASRVNALGEMASGLAHELTQPLTAILAQLQAGRRMLAQNRLAQDNMAALAPVLDDTVTQARRASAILERFRNWSQPQKLPRLAFDLRDALKNVETLLRPQAADHDIRLTFNLPAHPALVVADPVEMEQVVFNLVRNAIDATADQSSSGGQVTVTLSQIEGKVIIGVSDNGPGVPDEVRARLFTPFITTRTNGTGLGLALSQRLVERTGGEIALVDSHEGATFQVVLPREQEPAGAVR